MVESKEKSQDLVLKAGRLNYKAADWVGFMSINALKVLTVLDTRAAPNVIHQDAFPGLWVTPLGQKSNGLKDAG